jgi:hypothetical protein
MTQLRGTIIAAAVPLFLLGACAQTPGNTAAGAPVAGRESASAYPQGADDLVLRVESVGGFVPAERVAGALPTVSVYADGRVITDGPVPAIYPGPALPNLQVRTITPEQIQELVQQAGQAGVRNGADFGRPNVADAPSTRVTVVDGTGKQTVTVEALGEAQADDPRLTAPQRDARTKLTKYVGTLTSLSAGDGKPSPAAYDPERLAAIAKPWTEPGGGVPGQNPEKAWPGPALPGATLNANLGFGCVEVSGTQKDEVLTAAKSATMITPWSSGGKQWSITFRPLLPDEKDCATLKGDR